jgi:hypothetical protein
MTIRTFFFCLIRSNNVAQSFRFKLSNTTNYDAFIFLLNSKTNRSDGLEYNKAVGIEIYEGRQLSIDDLMMTNTTEQLITYYDEDSHEYVVDPGPGPYLPGWLASPLITGIVINENLLKDERGKENIQKTIDTTSAVFGGFDFALPGNTSHEDHTTAFYSTITSMADEKMTSYLGDPMSRLYLPVHDSFDRTTSSVVAITTAVLQWQRYFRNLVPRNVRGVTIVIENTCDGYYTYEINGPDVTTVGPGDLHESKFTEFHRQAVLEHVQVLADGQIGGMQVYSDGCLDKIHVYPTQVRLYFVL